MEDILYYGLFFGREGSGGESLRFLNVFDNIQVQVFKFAPPSPATHYGEYLQSFNFVF